MVSRIVLVGFHEPTRIYDLDIHGPEPTLHKVFSKKDVTIQELVKVLKEQEEEAGHPILTLSEAAMPRVTQELKQAGFWTGVVR